MHDSRWDEGRDEDPDLARGDHDERELNAGGARAARVRRQHEEEANAHHARAQQVADALDNAHYMDLDGDGGCVVWLDGEAAYWTDEYGTAYEMHCVDPQPLFTYAALTAEVVEAAVARHYRDV